MPRIEKYSFGCVSIDGRRYEKDLIIYPDRVQDTWWRKESHKLQLADIRDILGDPPEILVVGQGDSSRMQLDPGLHEALGKLNVQVLSAPTGKACDAFNRLAEKGKKVVAALHLTC